MRARAGPKTESANKKMKQGLNFLTGTGEMARLTREHDWSQSTLGVPEQWPLALPDHSGHHPAFQVPDVPVLGTGTNLLL